MYVVEALPGLPKVFSAAKYVEHVNLQTWRKKTFLFSTCLPPFSNIQIYCQDICKFLINIPRVAPLHFRQLYILGMCILWIYGGRYIRSGGAKWCQNLHPWEQTYKFTENLPRDSGADVWCKQMENLIEYFPSILSARTHNKKKLWKISITFKTLFRKGYW